MNDKRVNKVEEKKNIGALFDRIAGKYDFLNHLLSLNIDKRWRRRAVKHIQTESGSVLDVAIGTADLAIEIARQHKQLQIQGLDLSVEMMNVGKEKVARKGLESRISFMEGSALVMPFGDGCFDVVTCAYGVRNFSDLGKGLSEMQRVLRKGGELVILEFSYPKNKVVAWAYDLYFTHLLPFVGRLVSKDKTAYTYLNKSVKKIVWGEEMCEHIRTAGFTAVKHKTMTFGITTLYTATK